MECPSWLTEFEKRRWKKIMVKIKENDNARRALDLEMNKIAKKSNELHAKMIEFWKLHRKELK